MILYMIIATSSGCGFAVDPNSVSNPQGGIGALFTSAARLPRSIRVGLKSLLNSGRPGDCPQLAITKPVSVCFGHPEWTPGACMPSLGGLSAPDSGPVRMRARLADTPLPAVSPISCSRSAVTPFRRLPLPPLSLVPSASPAAASRGCGCASRTAASSAAPSSVAGPRYARKSPETGNPSTLNKLASPRLYKGLTRSRV